MRIAIVYPHVHKRGGVERYVFELAAALARTHEVSLVTGSPELLPPGPCRVIRVPFLSRPWFLSSITFSLASWLRLRRLRFDIVNVHGASSFTQDVVTAHSCHRAWFEFSLGQLPRFSRRWWLKILNPLHHLTSFIESVQYRTGHHRRVIAVSASVKDDLTRFYGVPDRAIAVIPSGVDCEEFHPRNRAAHRSAIRARHGIGENELLLLFLGNEFRRKGLDTVLEAMASRQAPCAKLIVAGKADPGPFRATADRLGLADRVIFVGATGDVAPLYAAADLFVLPTSYEAFGLVIIEAMASGLPVITTRQAGVAALIEHGVTGLLLDSPDDAEAVADGLVRLSSADARVSMGREARKRVEEFSWERVGAATEAVFQDVHVERSPS